MSDGNGERAAGREGGTGDYRAVLGTYEETVSEELLRAAQERVVERIFARDHTLWKPDPAEIANRLSWLQAPETMRGALPEIASLAADLRAEGYTHALLLGMGGSSLAPEVFAKTFGAAPNALELSILDSTDPAAVRAAQSRSDPARTLYVVSTKSGTTAETLSFFKYFYNRLLAATNAEEAGRHCVAVTDPGSALAHLAERLGFRRTFLNDPDVGGRYSALTLFGLVPAGLLGVDLPALLDRGRAMMERARRDDAAGAALGVAMGTLALSGRDKLTLIVSPPLAAFGAWVEQLVAESTGKEGRGILPVDGETPGPPGVYGGDRFFVYLRLDGDGTWDGAVDALEAAGEPVVRIRCADPLDLGGEFFRWEFAVAVAGRWLGINAFDQPDVEAAKAAARGMLDDYRESGELPALDPAVREGDVAVYTNSPATSAAGALHSFLAGANPGDYLSLQAYLAPSSRVLDALQGLRHRVRQRRRIATTLGYGPRFLHSTGQLHKGGANTGLFVQLTADDTVDAAIPDEAGSELSSVSFGVLKAAQALGDRAALLERGRRVIRFHLGADAPGTIERLTKSLTT